MACFKIYTHIQCILIQMAAIFYYVTVTPFVMVQFCPTFDMLFSGLNSTRKYHKTFSCNFLGSVRIMILLDRQWTEIMTLNFPGGSVLPYIKARGEVWCAWQHLLLVAATALIVCPVCLSDVCKHDICEKTLSDFSETFLVLWYSFFLTPMLDNNGTCSNLVTNWLFVTVATEYAGIR